LVDDPVVETNAPYTVSFATSGKDSRTTQMFINLVDNARLDGMGFSPFAKVVSGKEVVDAINSRHGETPDQGKIQSDGNRYLKTKYPNLSYIKQAKAVARGGGGGGGGGSDGEAKQEL
jgi:cyclophilin family peptidyl-prolyl cis-trans isomerase